LVSPIRYFHIYSDFVTHCIEQRRKECFKSIGRFINIHLNNFNIKNNFLCKIFKFIPHYNIHKFKILKPYRVIMIMYHHMIKIKMCYAVKIRGHNIQEL